MRSQLAIMDLDRPFAVITSDQCCVCGDTSHVVLGEPSPNRKFFTKMVKPFGTLNLQSQL